MKPTVRQRTLPTTTLSFETLGRRAMFRIACVAAMSSCNFRMPATAIADVSGAVDGSRWQPAGAANAAESYYDQLKAGETALVNLLRDWNEVTKTTNGAIDGDAVRRVVGTVGVSSPLFQHEKVLKTVGKSLDERDMIDIVDFTEATDDLVANLREVDFLAYSAIFSDPSGNVGREKESSAAYLERARVQTERAIISYRRLLKLLPLT